VASYASLERERVRDGYSAALSAELGTNDKRLTEVAPVCVEGVRGCAYGVLLASANIELLG
jgi:hypothetical protein